MPSRRKFTTYTLDNVHAEFICRKAMIHLFENEPTHTWTKFVKTINKECDFDITHTRACKEYFADWYKTECRKYVRIKNNVYTFEPVSPLRLCGRIVVDILR